MLHQVVCLTQIYFSLTDWLTEDSNRQKKKNKRDNHLFYVNNITMNLIELLRRSLMRARKANSTVNNFFDNWLTHEKSRIVGLFV